MARSLGEFNTPHSIAADNAGNIYVADRGNRRIQVFDSDGVFVREITVDVPVPPDAQSLDGQPADRPNRRHHAERRALGHLHHPRPDAISL